MKNIKIKILKDSNDKSETKFVSLNGKAYSVEVGKVVSVPEDLVKHVLLKGSLKDRISIIGDFQ